MAIRQFTVMIVRKRYSSPYRRSTYLVLSEDTLRTKRRFIKNIESRCEHWRDATYFLKDENGVFARFDIKDGKVEKVYKLSPITEEPYPCWTCFKR